jgi:hypothetical protein
MTFAFTVIVYARHDNFRAAVQHSLENLRTNERLCTHLRSPSRKDKRGVDLISDSLPFGRLWYGEPNAVANAIGYAEHRSRSYDAVIRVYDATGNVIETHQHKGEFREP